MKHFRKMSYRGRKRNYDGREEAKQSQIRVENATFLVGGAYAQGLPQFNSKRGRGRNSSFRGGKFSSRGSSGGKGNKEAEDKKEKRGEEMEELIPEDLRRDLPPNNLKILKEKLTKAKTETKRNEVLTVAYQKLAEVVASRRALQKARNDLKKAKIQPKSPNQEKEDVVLPDYREDQSESEGQSSAYNNKKESEKKDKKNKVDQTKPPSSSRLVTSAKPSQGLWFSKKDDRSAATGQGTGAAPMEIDQAN